jgi:hypothetical protein
VKYCLIKTVKPIGNKKFFIFFVLAAYIFIPMVDSMASDECTGIAPFQQGRGVEISYLNLSHGDVLSISDTNTNGDKSSPQKDTKDCCSSCCNAAIMLSNYNIKTLFSSVSIAFRSAFLTLLEPVFSINKPPQN